MQLILMIETAENCLLPTPPPMKDVWTNFTLIGYRQTSSTSEPEEQLLQGPGPRIMKYFQDSSPNFNHS